jgi:dihydroorotate dehydrogenase
MPRSVLAISTYERHVDFVGLLGAVARPILFKLDPESAHEWAIRALQGFPLPRLAVDDPRLAINVLGLHFPNPLGLGAGFDKDGEIVDPILTLGFGFTEVGTITPSPQGGNPPPRLFRLTRDQAVINRLGFCGDGFAAVHERLARRKKRFGIVGINLGAN